MDNALNLPKQFLVIFGGSLKKSDDIWYYCDVIPVLAIAYHNNIFLVVHSRVENQSSNLIGLACDKFFIIGYDTFQNYHLAF